MRLVIKVGTSIIAPGGHVDASRMRALVDQLDFSTHEYLIVSSGAIASGSTRLGLPRRSRSVPLMQACAAVGQSHLMHTYEQLFFGRKKVAQLLLSSEDFSSANRYQNLSNTLQQLLRLGVVPIINENDTVSVRELVGAFGDNDELSALVACVVKADWLVILTDVDGFYHINGNKRASEPARVVRRITPAMEASCNGHGVLARGGMRTKLRAARTATLAGVNVTIANGAVAGAIDLALRRRIGTFFPAPRYSEWA